MGEKLDHHRTLYLTKTMDEALVKEAERRKVPVMVLVREYLQEGLSRVGMREHLSGVLPTSCGNPNCPFQCD